jgi:hypothetical protein
MHRNPRPHPSAASSRAQATLSRESPTWPSLSGTRFPLRSKYANGVTDISPGLNAQRSTPGHVRPIPPAERTGRHQSADQRGRDNSRHQMHFRARQPTCVSIALSPRATSLPASLLAPCQKSARARPSGRLHSVMPSPTTAKPRLISPWAAAVGAVIVTPVIALGLWLWWPDSNKLTGYAARGDVAGVRFCLRFGVDPNAPSRWGWGRAYDGQTPLTAAAQYGRVEVLRLLLSSGADPNLRDFGPAFPHETPLSTAAMHGQLDICRVLLKAGADSNVLSNPRQPGASGNWTPLDWALQAEQSAIADLLRQRGARESGNRRDGD